MNIIKKEKRKQKFTDEQEISFDLENFLKDVGHQSIDNFRNMKDLILMFLDRKGIDVITRIKEQELDKICNMLHHTHKISVLRNYYIKRYEKDTSEYVPELDFKFSKFELCSGEKYVLQNLSLRLSLDGKSREELQTIISALVKTELEFKKAEAEGTKSESDDI